MTSALRGAAVPCYCCLQRRPPILPSSSTSTNPRYLIYGSVTWLGIRCLSPWKGLKHLGISLRRNYAHSEKKRKSNRMAVYASLFGVGAPEALVIGVVALLVFGPKGLAEVARNLGKTLRSFQPTIRELQEVSREFKSTIEREIGLDEMTSPINNSYRSKSIVNESQQAISEPNGSPIAETPEKHLKITEAEQATTTKSQADSPEEQPQAITTSKATTSISSPSEETASSSIEANARISSLERAEGEEDAEQG